jgi:hypothetical protein
LIHQSYHPSIFIPIMGWFIPIIDLCIQQSIHPPIYAIIDSFTIHWYNYRTIHLIYSIIDLSIQSYICLSSTPYWIPLNDSVSQIILSLNSPYQSCLINLYIDRSIIIESWAGK